MLNLVICDDSETYLNAAVSVVENYFDKTDTAAHIYKFKSEYEMRTWFNHFDEEVNIMLLDICLDSDTNGISIAKKIHDKNSATKIIFITAFLEQAADICETDFTYFVYKRSDWIEKLEKALDKAMSEIDEDKNRKIQIGSSTVYFDEIICLEAQKKNTVFHLAGKNDITIQKGINTFIDLLPNNFYACHRSYIVNFDKIENINKSDKTILLNGSILVPIPRAQYKPFIENYYNYLEKKVMWQ